MLFISCRFAKDEKSLTKYIANPNHGLLQEKTINGVNIKVTYRPQDFLVKQAISAGTAKTDSAINRLKVQYHKQLYFIVSLSKNSQEVLNSFAGNQAQFSEMVTRLAFGMSENITLTTSQSDTLELVDYVYPRMYGMSNSTDMLFAFCNRELKNSEWLRLTIHDPGLQTGDVNFKFNTKDIKRIPKLKLR
jgi:hypothetical protein